MYANDILVVIEVRNRNEMEVKGQKALDTIYRWCKENKLELSVSKADVIYLKTRLKDTQRIKIILQQERLQRLSDNKNLGVTLSETLKVKKYVLDVTSRGEAKFQKLSRLLMWSEERSEVEALKIRLSSSIRAVVIPQIDFHISVTP